MIVFCRSYIRELDGKLSKYWNALATKGLQLHFVGWSRGSKTNPDGVHDTYYELPASLGGGWRSLLKILKWNWFLWNWLLRNKDKIELVHVIDLDSALPAYLFCKLMGKPLVFDVYDKYSSLRHFPKGLKSAVDFLEKKIILSAQLAIIADPCRYEQHEISSDLNNVIVLENVPSIHLDTPTATDLPPPFSIGYFGVLEKSNRGLEDLLQVCGGRQDIKLTIVGYGELEDFFSNAAEKFDNVTFWGPKTAREGLNIMSTADILAGMYYLSVPNHRYAAPNKYFEHLGLGKPLLTTKGTPTGHKVQSQDTGWAISEGRTALTLWLDQLQADDIRKKGQNAHLLWQRHYQHYLQLHYNGVYVQKITQLLR